MNIYEKMAKAIGNPDRVYCKKCKREEKVDAATCLRVGWPKCCGYTMAIPEGGLKK